MNNDSCIQEVKKLEKEVYNYFNNKILNSSKCIAYLNRFNNKLESLYRDSKSYSELEFLNIINNMLNHIHSSEQPKHYNKFRTSLEIRLIKAWYNIVYHRNVNIYLSQMDEDVVELFYLKYIDNYYTEELVRALWGKLCWFIITKSPNDDEYAKKFSLYFKSLTIKQFEKCYFYLSLLVNIAKNSKLNIHDLIISRLEKLLNHFIIYQEEKYGKDTIEVLSKNCNVINPLNGLELSIPVNTIKITKQVKDTKEDNVPVFLGNYVMKDNPLPVVSNESNKYSNIVLGKNNKVITVKYRRKIRKLEGNENV